MKSVLTFNGAMDQDTSPMYMQKGDVISRRNARITVGSGSDSDVNKAIQDTVAISRYMPNGTNKTIGWCKYEEGNGVVYFNYNSEGNHSIYWLNLVTRENTLLLMSSVLAFTAKTLVDARVIGDELVWVTIRDDSTVIDPRVISIARAIQYSNKTTVSGYIQDLTELGIGTISGTVHEDTILNSVGSISGTVNEDIILIEVYYGDISGTVYEESTYETVSGYITQN